MAKYTIPGEYYLPLHHPRPRFKNEVEDVLGYMAFAIADIGRLPRDAFKQQLNAQIRKYGRLKLVLSLACMLKTMHMLVQRSRVKILQSTQICHDFFVV